MKSIVLTQPMYIPWRGLIEQIKLSEILVYYDDVQLPKGGGKGRGFETRVQIKTQLGWKWLSIPIDRSAGGYLTIKDAHFANNEWRNVHLVNLRTNYNTALFFKDVWSKVVEPIYENTANSLADFCIHSISCLLSYLGLQKPYYRSSEIKLNSNIERSERVLACCKYFNADRYITGWGAQNYINYQLFDDNGVEIRYMDYSLNEYPQLWGAFNPYVSILDLFFNVGPNSIKYLTSTTMNWRDFLKRSEISRDFSEA